MPVVTRTRVIVSKQYQQTISIADWSQADTKAMTDFGEPLVQCGGHFDNGSGLVFDLPPNPRRLKSGFPVVQIMDGNTDLDAKAKCAFWGTEVEARIAAAITALRAQIDDFSGTQCTTY